MLTETNFYHVNNMNTLKAMIYLDNVNEKNGPFEYVKGSFRKIKILIWCRRKVNETYNYIIETINQKPLFIKFFKIKHEFQFKSSKEFEYINKIPRFTNHRVTLLFLILWAYIEGEWFMRVKDLLYS